MFMNNGRIIFIDINEIITISDNNLFNIIIDTTKDECIIEIYPFIFTI